MSSDESNCPRRWPSQAANVLVFAGLPLLVGGMVAIKVAYSASTPLYLILCSIHMVVCVGLFRWAGAMSGLLSGWQAFGCRMIHITIGLTVYGLLMGPVYGAFTTASRGVWRSGEHAIVQISAAFIVLSFFCCWLITLIAGLLPLFHPTLKTIRFHLGTLIVATVLAGALLGANLQPVFVRFPSAPTFCYGWPVTFYFWENGITSFQIRPFVCDLLLWALLLALAIWRCERWYRKPLRKPAHENAVQAP